MVERRLEKEFDRMDIKGALPLGRNTTGRKDWNFLFLSVRNVAPLSDWLDMLGNLPNEIAGIYLLPVETEQLVKAIKKAVETENISQASEWQMLVTHNKTGGLRQVVYRKGRILFTRLAQPVGGNAPGVIAGHIEQEVLNTIEYIRRMNFEDKAGLDIFIITASEVKKQLEAARLKTAQTYVLTPHEIAGQLGLEGATEPKDKFADVVILAYFGKTKKAILRLITPTIQKTRMMVLSKTALQIFSIAIIPLAVLLTIFNIYTSVVVYGRTEDQQVKLTRVKNQQRDLQQRANAQAANKADVETMVSLYEQFTKNAVVPFNFLAKVAQAKGTSALSETVQFAVGEVVDQATKKTLNTITFRTSINYPNRAPTIEAYLKEITVFAQRIRDAFKTLQVGFSGLPGQGDFSLSVEGGPTVAGDAPKTKPLVAEKNIIELSIEGKIDEDTRKAMFEMPKIEEKKPLVVPLQKAPVQPLRPTSAPIPAPLPISPQPAKPLERKP